MMRCRAGVVDVVDCGGLWWIFFSRCTGNVSERFGEVGYGTTVTFFKTTFSLIDYKRRSTRSTTSDQKWLFTWSFAIDHRCRRSTKTGLKMVDLWWIWWMSHQVRCARSGRVKALDLEHVHVQLQPSAASSTFEWVTTASTASMLRS
jgi:hypothetical protein